MQAAQRVAHGPRLVGLDETVGDADLGETILPIGLEKEPAGVAKDARLEHEHTGQRRIDDAHPQWVRAVPVIDELQQVLPVGVPAHRRARCGARRRL